MEEVRIDITKMGEIWIVDNMSNGKKAQIRQQYEWNMKTASYGRFYVDDHNGREVRPTNGSTAFDDFNDAKSAAERSVQ